MIDKWKKVIYEYAHNRNQLEAGYTVEPLLTTVRDDRYLRRQELRLKRLQSGHRDRRVNPLRNETGLRIRRIEERVPDSEFSVDIELRRSLDYTLLGMKHTEDRLEHERLTVSRTGTKWLITAIDLDVPERMSSNPPPSESIVRAREEELQLLAHRSNRTMPYLNPQFISGYAFDHSFRPVLYNRQKAQQYANTWWNGANPNYATFEVDCTNFVSQCLFAGGAPMNYTGKRETGWWYQGYAKNQEMWSFSWAVANSLGTHLMNSKTGLRAEVMDSPTDLTIGDVICYDWDGNGRIQHNTFVSAIDASGMPLVNAHTVDSKHRYWDYKDSYAWTPNTKYRFLHIPDQL